MCGAGQGARMRGVRSGGQPGRGLGVAGVGLRVLVLSEMPLGVSPLAQRAQGRGPKALDGCLQQEIEVRTSCNFHSPALAQLSGLLFGAPAEMFFPLKDPLKCAVVIESPRIGCGSPAGCPASRHRRWQPSSWALG